MLHFRYSVNRLRCNNLQKSFKVYRSSTSETTRQGVAYDVYQNAGQVVNRAGTQQEHDIKEAPKSGKLPARLPLVKTFFAGGVDKELLAFPEVIARDDMSQLHNEMLPLKNFFAEEINSYEINASRALSNDLLNSVRQLGLYGINVPNDNEGKGWEWSASLTASEPESNSTDIALGLHTHRVVVDLLKEYGTEAQKENFLSKLATGSLVATEAVYEYNMAEDDYFNTIAEFAAESNCWYLSGQKSYVITGMKPTDSRLLFLVIAQTLRANVKGDAGRGSTIFLVDSNTPGVTLGTEHETFGCRGLKMQHVKFDKAKIPQDCVIGEPHDISQIGDAWLRSNRLRYAMVGLGAIKSIINEITPYCINLKQCGAELKDMENVQLLLSNATCSAYALESMIYLTAGILDEFEKPDVATEAAISKYYMLKTLLNLATHLTDLYGPKSLHSSEKTNTIFRNAAQLYTQGESIDILRTYIGLTGLQHAGMLMNDVIGKNRNPLYNPGHIFRKFLETSTIEHPNTNMKLNEHLHPTLEPAAQYIEHSIARLQMSVEILFTRHGNSIIEHHGDIKRLTDMATALFAMFASTARASRSYCIGLHLADHELLLASTICIQGHALIKVLASEIHFGDYINGDNNLKRLSKQVAKSKSYFPVHPLTYNF